ncbi:MAG: flagellar hook-associated protein 3 [Gammaproteobacteria bacterium]|nr:MAG: flagellar hook-associated protein 3 [Gammaproteobacteria bacterium]
MRISTSQTYQQAISNILDQQAQLTRTQLQLGSGRRMLTPADDPAAASQVLNVQQTLSSTTQYQANSDAARARLELEETTLTGVGDLLQHVRTLAVQANNATQTNETRAAIAIEVRARLDELLALANTTDANGEYLFAGFQGKIQPFSRSAGGAYSYSGDQGQRYLQIGPTRQIALGDSGSAVFQAIRNGNGTFVTAHNTGNNGTGVISPGAVNGAFVSDTYTLSFTQVLSTDPITYTVTGAVSGVVASGTYAGGAAISFNGAQISVSGTPANGDSFTVSPSANQDMFTTLKNLAVALETPVSGVAAQAKLNNIINRALTDLDQSLGKVLEIRASIGARLNTVDSQQAQHESLSVDLQKTLSFLQDVDYAQAASLLNQQLLALQAAQQAFVKTQGLSLFNFLR